MATPTPPAVTTVPVVALFASVVPNIVASNPTYNCLAIPIPPALFTEPVVAVVAAAAIATVA